MLRFNDLKTKVGVDDIAYSLGYRLNRTAGVGKYIEMAMPDGRGGHGDTLIISNPNNKATQLYFHRNGSKGGDVVDLIMENINSFDVSGKDKWDVALKVMSKFANEPIPDYGDGKYLVEAGFTGNQIFDPKRWDVTPARENMHHVMTYFEPRGIRQETVEAFAPFLSRIKDLNAKNFNNYNLGFPYRIPGSDDVVGYEIRGYKGFKSKAAGSNSSTAAWIVDMSGNNNPLDVKNVFFAESGFDIMAFYQLNHQNIEKECSVFVSLGGSFSDQQFTNIMRHYNQARAVDCCDNDLNGRIYGIRMAGLMDGVHFNISRTEDVIHLNVKGKEHLLDAATATMRDLAKFMKLNDRVDEWKPAKAFKDWNDQVMNKPMTELVLTNKYQRNEKLAEDRAKAKVLTI